MRVKKSTSCPDISNCRSTLILSETHANCAIVRQCYTVDNEGSSIEIYVSLLNVVFCAACISFEKPILLDLGFSIRYLTCELTLYTDLADLI